MSDPGPDDRAVPPLAGGRLLAEITNRIVAFVREHYGRGPIKAKTYMLDNLIVCVLTDGFTAIGTLPKGAWVAILALHVVDVLERLLNH